MYTVPHDQWFTTHIDPGWKVPQVKLWLLSKCLPYAAPPSPPLWHHQKRKERLPSRPGLTTRTPSPIPWMRTHRALNKVSCHWEEKIAFAILEGPVDKKSDNAQRKKMRYTANGQTRGLHVDRISEPHIGPSWSQHVHQLEPAVVAYRSIVGPGPQSLGAQINGIPGGCVHRRQRGSPKRTFNCVCRGMSIPNTALLLPSCPPSLLHSVLVLPSSAMVPPPTHASASSAPALPSRPCTVHGELWQALRDPWRALPLCRNHQRRWTIGHSPITSQKIEAPLHQSGCEPSRSSPPVYRCTVNLNSQMHSLVAGKSAVDNDNRTREMTYKLGGIERYIFCRASSPSREFSSGVEESILGGGRFDGLGLSREYDAGQRGSRSSYSVVVWCSRDKRRGVFEVAVLLITNLAWSWILNGTLRALEVNVLLLSSSPKVSLRTLSLEPSDDSCGEKEAISLWDTSELERIRLSSSVAAVRMDYVEQAVADTLVIFKPYTASPTHLWI
ncbi:hypothetical protein C8J57DRAFT_1213517 [Mycena rebaudengoi]|nr:hypothetical protein C8J57DRAFT_1213517 [Mycena rebaudengoi]